MNLNNPNIYDGTRSLIEALDNDPIMFVDSEKDQVGFNNPLFEYEDEQRNKLRSTSILSRENVAQDFRERGRFRNQTIVAIPFKFIWTN